MKKAASFRYMNKRAAKDLLDARVTERESHVEESLDDIFHTVTQADLNKLKSA